MGVMMTTANEKPSSKATLNEPHASSHLKLSNCVKLSTQKSHKKQDKLAMHNRIQQVCRKMPKSPSDLSFSDYINGKKKTLKELVKFGEPNMMCLNFIPRINEHGIFASPAPLRTPSRFQAFSWLPCAK